MRGKQYKKIAIQYADGVIDGSIIASEDIVNACKRFKQDLLREDLELRTKEPDLVITIMETLFVHKQGEAPDGTPLRGKPLKLEPWQIFIVYNILGFWYTGTNETRFKEAWIELGRKNGKTSFIAALSFAIALVRRRSGSKIYVVAAALKQALESFDFFCEC